MASARKGSQPKVEQAPALAPAPQPPSPRGGAGPSLSVTVVGSLAQLKEHVENWEDLARSALEPNPFYEPWLLIPALNAFAADVNLRLVLIYAPNPTRKLGPRILCGFFPLELTRGYKGLPVKTLSLWKRKYISLGTPLVRTGYSRHCVETFFEWLRTNPDGCALMEFTGIRGEGPFHQLLVDHFRVNGTLHFVADCFTRAFLRPAASADDYVAAKLSSKHRKATRRHETKLAETGRLEYAELGPGDDVDAWLEEFLQIEAAGWKGKEGSALASKQADRAFFVSAAKEAFHRGRLMMLAIRHNGRAIAARCSFAAGDGAFTFKIAYAEDYARFSPGMLMEIENVRRLHANRAVNWMDSCTVWNNFMFNRLWNHRLTIRDLVVGTGKAPGDLLVSLLPVLRWFRRRVVRPQAGGQIEANAA